jgi:hypothetical protein
LGADRWSIKPEVALSHPFGTEQRWEFDAYANVFFYTNNTSFQGRELLHQDPLPGIEGHISYSLHEGIWVSVDTRYSFRGETFLNGINQNDAQRNFILGSELNLPLSSQDSLTVEFAKAAIHHNSDAVVGFSLRYDHSW